MFNPLHTYSRYNEFACLIGSFLRKAITGRNNSQKKRSTAWIDLFNTLLIAKFYKMIYKSF